MTHRADSDQLANLDLYCLQRQGIPKFSKTRVNIISANFQTEHVNDEIMQYPSTLFLFNTKIEITQKWK